VLAEVMAARDDVIAILNADGFIAEPDRSGTMSRRNGA
jgi:hypothetical protein